MNENTNNNRNNLGLGVILILIGIVFLVQNITDFDIGNWNWWALFILIPAFGYLSRARNIYRAEGRMSDALRGQVVGGAVLLLVATIFLFDLSWGMLWPLFLIIFGLGALLIRS